MTRNEREQALWHDAYMLAMSQDPSPAESSCLADAAVAEFRKRYPPDPSATPAAWCDEPPFERNGSHHPCWIQGATGVQIIYWSLLVCGWQCYDPMQSGLTPLNGRRVCPINKPQEPTT